MMHPPRTIKAALLTGLLVIFTVWLASTAYFTSHLAETQEQTVAIHARHTRGEELLFAVRSQVLLGSIYLRDTLVESNQSATGADQLRTLQAQVSQELEQYRAIESVDNGAAWRQLKDELGAYWDAAVRLAVLEPDNRIAAQSRLQTEVIPKRDGIVRLSDEIRQVMADNVTREQQELSDANRQVRRRIWETTAVAVVVGLAIAVLSTWYVGRLEATVREDHAEVAQNRQELRVLVGTAGTGAGGRAAGHRTRTPRRNWTGLDGG